MFNTNIGSNLLVKNDNTEVDTSMPKIIGLGIVGSLLGIAISYFLNQLIKFPGAANFTWSASLVVFFIIIFFLQTIFIKSTKINSLIAAIETIALSIFGIIFNYSLVSLIGIVLIYLSLFLAAKRSRDELTNQLKINIHKIAKASLPKIITAIAIVISILYSQPFFPEKLVISKNLIKSIIGPTEILIPIMNKYMNLGLDNFSVEKTVAEIAKDMAATSKIPVSSKMIEQSLISQASQIGLTIKSNESLLDAAYNFVNEKIKNLNNIAKWGVFAAIFLLIFFTIKGIFWLFYWLLYLLIYLFYEILMALGFCKLSYEQISKEIIIL